MRNPVAGTPHGLLVQRQLCMTKARRGRRSALPLSARKETSGVSVVEELRRHVLARLPQHLGVSALLALVRRCKHALEQVERILVSRLQEQEEQRVGGRAPSRDERSAGCNLERESASRSSRSSRERD